MQMNALKKFAVFATALSLLAVAVPLDTQAREGKAKRVEDEPHSLASPNYEGYRPAWANPYAEPEELGVNDDPTPFDPADVDSGPSPLEPNAF